jgi:hypothetical protein
MLSILSARDASRAAAHDGFDFRECGHTRVSGGGHGQGPMRQAALDSPFGVLAGKKSVDQAGSEGVAAADAIEDFERALRNMDDLTVVESDGTPVVLCCGVRRSEGGRDELEIGVELTDTMQHRFVAGDGQVGEVAPNAFDGDTEGRGKVFFVAEEYVDGCHQFAIHFLSFRLAADGFPKRFAIIEVVGDYGSRGSRGLNSGAGDGSGTGRKCGKDAAGMQPAGASDGEDLLPVEVAGLAICDSGVSAIGATDSRSNTESSLGKVQAVADSSADSVIRNPTDERGVDPTLEDQVFKKLSNRVFRESGNDGGSQAETSAESACDVVLSAAFPGAEVASSVNALFAGIEAKHDFAEADAVPAAGFSCFQDEWTHGQHFSCSD